MVDIREWIGCLYKLEMKFICLKWNRVKQSLKGHIMGRLPIAERFYLIFFCSIFLILSYLLLATLQNGNVSYLVIAGVFADSFLITFLSLFLRGKWKYLTVFIPFILSFLIWVIIIYYRNFNDFIPGPLYLNNQVSDPLVLTSAMASMRISDLLLLFFSLFPLAYILRVPREMFIGSNIKMRDIGLFGIGTLVMWLVPYGYLFIINSIKFDGIDAGYNIQIIFPKNDISWKAVYNGRHFTGYVLHCLANLNKPPYTFSQEDVAFVKSHIRQASDGRISLSNKKTPISRSNIIIIIVESLPWKVFDLPITERVAPTLFSLSKDSTIILKKMKSLAMMGRSADAQFIYNTGLLPLKDSPFVTFYASNDYPSIAKALRIPSIEIIGENMGLWSHGATSKSYGYSNLISSVAETAMNQDSLIFQKAGTVLDNVNPPLLLTVTTLSMHDPYVRQAVTQNPDISQLPFEDDRDREYFQRLNHFDRNLSWFLTKLKHDHVFENSIILIMGDHEIASWEIPPYLHDDQVPLMIINSSLHDTRNSEITQLDVFPTILDLKGIDYRILGENYRGLGKSIFNTYNRDSLPHEISEEDFKVSEILIKSSLLNLPCKK